ncbi:eukaryotic translation initiation factor 2A [Arapaima gigas]
MPRVLPLLCSYFLSMPRLFLSKMAPPTPLLAVRGSSGTSLLCGPPLCEEHRTFQKYDPLSKYFVFSRDGSLFGWCNGEKVHVVKVADCSLLLSLDLPKTAMFNFSPLNSVLVTWQSYSKTQDNPQGDPNLQLWNLHTGSLLKSFYQKKAEGWCPSWSDDESIAVRSVSNELHFFENNKFDNITTKLHLQKVNEFVLSPGPQPSRVAVYVPGSKGAPSFVRLYQYPNFGGPTSALANKSFFKADRVTMLWNKKATAVLVTASTEVDKTGASYYGEQTLHYLAVNGESAVVQLPKNGPIYDVAWNPNSTEFCVVYGFMPAKVTVFDLKCNAVFDFGTGPRNAAFYSPQGHLLVLAGFGNLRGQMEVWDVKKYKQVSKPQAPDSTHFSWCPDGEHIVTATCSPRLRVCNGFKIWHYTGSVLYQDLVPERQELWEVLWQPFPDGTFPERPVRYQAVPSDLGSTEPKPAQAYRPPALRNKPATASSKLHEEEPPQNVRPGFSGEKVQSKTALKNQKKREAKKAEMKTDIITEAPHTPDPTPVPNCPAPASADPETDKKIKNLRKKLKAIEQLKEQQAAGKTLQKNQIEKILLESQLLQDLEDLELGL